MEEKIKLSILIGIYGNLLTEKQQKVLEDYYNNDFSLSEIAENNNITRQAVNDIINKSKNKLLEYEEKLLFMDKIFKQEKIIKNIIEELNNMVNKDISKTRIEKITKQLQQVIEL